jgi:hypothetical protein
MVLSSHNNERERERENEISKNEMKIFEVKLFPKFQNLLKYF